jgi:hypothetical protein
LTLHGPGRLLSQEYDIVASQTRKIEQLNRTLTRQRQLYEPPRPSMSCIDPRPVSAKGDDVVSLGWNARNIHSRRPRGIRYSQALNSGRPQLEHPLYVGNWHMAFEDHPVDNGGVARYQCARDARVALEGPLLRSSITRHIATKGLFHLRRPLLAATATGSRCITTSLAASAGLASKPNPELLISLRTSNHS